MLDYAFVADSITYFLLLSKEHKMSKLTVKIKRTTLIPKLQETMKAAQARKAQFDKDMAAYQTMQKNADLADTIAENKINAMTPATLAKFIAKASKEDLGMKADYGSVTLRFDYSLIFPKPSNPVNPASLPENAEFTTKSHWKRGYGHVSTCAFMEKQKAIQNAINILSLSEDEFVSTSSYNEVAKFL